MQEDIQGILSKGKVESYHTQTFRTNVSFRVSAHALVKRQKERLIAKNVSQLAAGN